MSDHRSQKLFLRALAGETLATPPVWLMRQAGRYLPEYRDLRRQAATFLEFCYTPDLTVEATLQPLRRYGFDAAILFSDILVIPDALGQPLQFQEGVGPVLEPLRRIEDLRKLSMERAEDHLAPVMTTVFRLSQEIPKTTALIGFAGAPWTVATYMVEGRGGSDFSTIKGWAYKDPKGFSDLINLLVEVSATYLINQIKNGAEAIQLFDTWAGVLSETQFQKWVIEPTRQIIQKIRQVSPSVPILGFPRGAGAMIETFVRETGVTGVSMDSSVSAKWATQHLQSLCTVQGNLDNQLLVAGGKALDQEVDRLVEILGRGPYIFNLGHGIVPQTPPEHVDQLVSRLRRDA